MPAVGLGVFQAPPEQTTSAVEAALAAGYRHIDTAASYGNERQVGDAVRGSGVDRTDVFLETKIWISDYGYEQTLHGFDKSADFAQRDVQAFGAQHGIVTQAWSPIGGITFYRDGDHTSTLADPVIGEIAQAHGRTPAQVMLRWHLQQGRAVITKSTRAERIAENIDVFDFELTDEQLAAIDDLDTGRRAAQNPATSPWRASADRSRKTDAAGSILASSAPASNDQVSAREGPPRAARTARGGPTAVVRRHRADRASTSRSRRRYRCHCRARRRRGGSSSTKESAPAWSGT
jgi:diketogulonate reductase-like aldo/keto reductase